MFSPQREHSQVIEHMIEKGPGRARRPASSGDRLRRDDEHHPTKQRLLDAGLAMLLEHGYNDLGIQALLAATAPPRGPSTITSRTRRTSPSRSSTSYMTGSTRGSTVAWATRGDRHSSGSPVLRDDAGELPDEGYMGCLLGGLGQELSGVSEVFRQKIEGCFSEIASR